MPCTLPGAAVSVLSVVGEQRLREALGCSVKAERHSHIAFDSLTGLHARPLSKPATRHPVLASLSTFLG